MLTSFIKYFFLVNNVCATCTDGAKNDKACKTTSTSEELALFQHVAAKVSPPRTRGQSKLNEEANPTVLVKRSALAEPAETAELAEPGELAEPAEPAEPAELAEPAVADAPSDAVQDIENVLQDIAKNEQKAADHEETEAADLQLNEQHDTKVFQPVVCRPDDWVECSIWPYLDCSNYAANCQTSCRYNGCEAEDTGLKAVGAALWEKLREAEEAGSITEEEARPEAARLQEAQEQVQLLMMSALKAEKAAGQQAGEALLNDEDDAELEAAAASRWEQLRQAEEAGRTSEEE